MAGHEGQCVCSRQPRHLRAVNAGQVDGGIIYHYYWFRDQAKTKEISGHTALHYSGNQAPGIRQPVRRRRAGIQQKKDQAQQFLKFITSKAGQEVLNGTSFSTRRQRRAANPALPPLDSLQAPAVNPSNLDSARRSPI